MVSARSVAPALVSCLDPPRRMYSANSVSVFTLYCTPPASPGSTKGIRSVSAVKSANQLSALDVRRTPHTPPVGSE
eukprot:3045409-Pleurochrysis_carterae.AAC.1